MNKVLTFGVASIAVAGAVFLGANSTSALNGNGQNNNQQATGQGYGYQRSLDSRAAALSMTADELKTALETKTMLEIAQEKGIAQEQLQAKMSEAAQARWQERGLSEAEIQERTATMEERQADCDGTGDHQGQGSNGYGRNRAE